MPGDLLLELSLPSHSEARMGRLCAPPPKVWGGSPLCRNTPVEKQAPVSAFFSVPRKTFDPGFLHSFLSPPIPGCPPLWRAHPSPPPHAHRGGHGQAGDKGAFLQSASLSSHKFSGSAQLAVRKEGGRGLLDSPIQSEFVCCLPT